MLAPALALTTLVLISKLRDTECTLSLTLHSLTHPAPSLRPSQVIDFEYLVLQQLALGPALSGAPPHIHEPAFNLLVKGAKLWVIFPTSAHAHCNFTNMNALVWWRSYVLPLLQPVSVRGRMGVRVRVRVRARLKVVMRARIRVMRD